MMMTTIKLLGKESSPTTVPAIKDKEAANPDDYEPAKTEKARED
jgi:hypothetical protein